MRKDEEEVLHAAARRLAAGSEAIDRHTDRLGTECARFGGRRLHSTPIILSINQGIDFEEDDTVAQSLRSGGREREEFIADTGLTCI